MSVTQILTKPNASSANMELSNGGGGGVGAGARNLESFKNAKRTKGFNKGIQGRSRFGENGFEEGGGYMAVKRAKLDNQFNMSTRGFNGGNDSEQDISEIFKGVSIYINGYTNPPEPELREIFILHGGTFHPYNSTRTTYQIATNLSAPSKARYGSKTITPDWIMDSIEAGHALDTRKYKLYDQNQEKNQMTLTQIMSSSKKPGDATASKANDMASPSKPIPESNGTAVPNGNGLTSLDSAGRLDCDDVNADDIKDRVSDSEEEFFECSQEFVPSPLRMNTSNVPITAMSTTKMSSAKVSSDEKSKKIQEKDIAVVDLDMPSSNESVKVCSPPPKALEQSSTLNHTATSPPKNDRIKISTDEGFIEDFFGRSRLHLISEQKKEMQVLIGNLRKNIDSHAFPNLQKFEVEFGNGDNSNALSFSSDEVILMHVDLDCFFASVGLLSRPHLRGKPVVVTHSTGKTHESKSDIACASYEARKFGIRNGMWVGDAKAKCPDLQVIPYDFEEYRRISKLFYEAVASVTLDVEASSVDEMVIDATTVLKKVPGSTPEDLAAFLRKIILESTKCPASIGIGNNRLLAKLAVKLAKPDGVHYLKDDDAPEYIKSLPVRDLPGIGYNSEDKLRESFNAETCGDLLKVPFKDLKTALGEKTAEKVLNLCKGIDTAEIKIGLERPKSLSVDVNFGIRFTKDDEVTQFLMKICKELGTRAERIQAVSKHFSLKLLIRKKGAGDPLKPGGHGIVDSMTRSRSLLNPTRSWHEFYKTAASLIRQMRVPPSEYRGVGVVLTDLSFDCDKTNKKSVQRTLTDMPVSRAQKMLSIISQKKNRALSNETISTNKSDAFGFIPLSPPDNNSEVTPDETMSNNNSRKTVPDTSNDGNSSAVVQNGHVIAATNNIQEKPVVESTKTDLSKLPVDIAVLRQLPREIAEEQCQIYGINKEVLDEVDDTLPTSESANKDAENANTNAAKADNYYDNVETVDQSFLLALPENVRQDVLIQLQEAKGRRTITDPVKAFDDQQPCSSRQALERSRKLELDLQRSKENDDAEPLAEKTTPIISYSSNSSARIDPKKFWDITVDFTAVSKKPCNRPSLNACVEPSEVRNMIREGLEVVTDPVPEEVEPLEKYFIQLISDGWIEQTEVLLNFIHRKAIQLGADSKWTPFLNRIIDNTQERCKELYHGEFTLE